MPSPFRLVSSALVAATSLAVGVVIAAQQPRITNGKIALQPAGSPLAQSFRALVASQADAGWIGYMVPVVDSERIMCCFGGDNGTWVNGNVVVDGSNGCCRACRLEPAADGTSMATRAPAAASRPVVRLEAFGSDGRLVPRCRSRGRSHQGVLGGLRARRRWPDDHLARGRRPGRQHRAARNVCDAGGWPSRSDRRRRDQRHRAAR